MEILDVIRQAQGGNAIANIARSHGISDEQAEAALAALVPQIASRLERNTLSRGGLADLVGALGDPRHGMLLERSDVLAAPETQRAGIDLLESLIGNKDQSRAIAARASQASGLGEGLIKQLLPYLLPMIIGALAKSSGGSLGDILQKLPGGTSNAGGRSQPAPAPRSPGWTGPATAPRPGQSPLPLPGDHTPIGGDNSYSDLSDVIRSGGAGGLPGVIRSILGGLLGFQSRGVMGWLLRLIVMRWGWGILRAILGGLLGRR